MCAKAKDTEPKKAKKDRGTYNSSLQSLLDIWNVLAAYATPDKPLTAGQIAKLLERDSARSVKQERNQSYLKQDDIDESGMTQKQKAQRQAAANAQDEDAPESPPKQDTYASAQTVDRYFPHAADIVNTLFPHTVVRESGKPSILHTYPHNETLHIVLEEPTGEPLWDGNMTAILTENPLNPIPYSSLTRMLPKLMEEYDAKKAPNLKGDTPEHPPISLAGVVAQPKAGGKIRYVPATEWENSAKNSDKKQSPTRRFFLESILSPGQWRILSDLILVYPYISEKETNKFLSAMKRMAPGVRNWSGQRYAPKNPTAVNFEHIETLDDSIRNQHKIMLIYGKYQLALGSDRRWHPKLQPMEKNNGRMTVDPYAMMWSNGYYYLVCKDGDIMRNLRVDRIIQIMATTVPFEKDPNFDPYAYRDRSPVMYPGEPTLIRLRCSTDRISTLMDFFGTAILDYSVSKNTPSETTVTLKASEKGVRLFALQYADEVEVLDPPSLRNEIAETLKAAASRYP